MSARRPHPAYLLLLALPLAAQQGVTTYRNFHHYPTGQWQQELQGFTEGRPMGPPVTQTNCTAPLDPARAAAIKNFGNQIGAMNACTTRLLRDEERLAESEQVCNPGPSQQTIHTTMHAVDDHTLKVETVSTLGSHSTTMVSTVRYLGACTAAQQAEAAQTAASMPAMPAMPRLTPQQCAELAESKRDLNGSLQSCGEQPAGERAACVSSLQAAAARLDTMLRSCSR